MKASRICISRKKSQTFTSSFSSRSSPTPPSSISFSGAGFLGSYHIGVANCLVDNGILPGPKSDIKKDTPILLGSSAGSLVSSGVLAGVTGEDSMNVLLGGAKHVREKGGMMDTIRPGVSLIDSIEELARKALKEACNDDIEYFQYRIQNGRLLRIVLTDASKALTQEQMLRNPNHAYAYIDSYRDFDDVIAACMLSSFVPGFTGPIFASSDKTNTTVKRSTERIQDLISQNPTAIKDYHGNAVVSKDYLDGGIVSMFPVMNNETWIVSPFNGDYAPQPFIAPSKEARENLRTFTYNGIYQIGVNLQNFKAFFQMAFSSDESLLQEIFYRGYDDAKAFLKDRNFIN